jgi:hypothetical protein
MCGWRILAVRAQSCNVSRVSIQNVVVLDIAMPHFIYLTMNHDPDMAGEAFRLGAWLMCAQEFRRQ